MTGPPTHAWVTRYARSVSGWRSPHREEVGEWAPSLATSRPRCEGSLLIAREAPIFFGQPWQLADAVLSGTIESVKNTSLNRRRRSSCTEGRTRPGLLHAITRPRGPCGGAGPGRDGRGDSPTGPVAGSYTHSAR